MAGKRQSLPKSARQARIAIGDLIGKITFWLLLFAAVLSVSGCDPVTKYKTLSFFFDGVPDPARTAAVSGLKNAPDDRKAAEIVPRASIHGPFASKDCEACHIREQGNKLVLPIDRLCNRCHELNISNKKWVHGPVASAGCRVCHNPHTANFPFLLAAPETKVCYRCHEEESVLKNKVHRDLTVGCLQCHTPHASDRKYLLR